MNVSENDGYVSWRFQTQSLTVVVMGNLTQPQKAENAARITIRSLWATVPGTPATA
jgi:hypothetical protein